MKRIMTMKNGCWIRRCAIGMLILLTAIVGGCFAARSTAEDTEMATPVSNTTDDRSPPPWEVHPWVQYYQDNPGAPLHDSTYDKYFGNEHSRPIDSREEMERAFENFRRKHPGWSPEFDPREDWRLRETEDFFYMEYKPNPALICYAKKGDTWLRILAIR